MHIVNVSSISISGMISLLPWWTFIKWTDRKNIDIMIWHPMANNAAVTMVAHRSLCELKTKLWVGVHSMNKLNPHNIHSLTLMGVAKLSLMIKHVWVITYNRNLDVVILKPYHDLKSKLIDVSKRGSWTKRVVVWTSMYLSFFTKICFHFHYGRDLWNGYFRYLFVEFG